MVVMDTGTRAGLTRFRGDASSRFWAKVAIPEDPSECWKWRGSRNRRGYGSFNQGGDGTTIEAHLFAYRDLFGEVPDGRLVHHRCHNPSCVNPAHIEAATPYVNVVVESNNPKAIAHLRGECVQGHSAENFYRRISNGKPVYCRACRREKRAQRRTVTA